MKKSIDFEYMIQSVWVRERMQNWTRQGHSRILRKERLLSPTANAVEYYSSSDLV